MVLVFGGTTEGKQIIEVLNTLNIPFLYSTKTKTNTDVGKFGVCRFGALQENEMLQLVSEYQIEYIVNGSHPFAVDLHKTIATIATKSEIEVYRLERKYPQKLKENNVKYVKDYDELQHFLGTQQSTSCLFLTGVQTIEKLTSYWMKNLSYFRILDRNLSIEIALKSHFPKERLILGMPNKIVNDEVALFKKLNTDLIVTKESGESGALSLKIEAAKVCGILIVIIEKPVLPKSFIIVENKQVLEQKLRNR